MGGIVRRLRDIYRNWQANSVRTRVRQVEARLSDLDNGIGGIGKHLGDVNFSLGVLNEHVLEEIRAGHKVDKSLNDEMSNILISIENMNKNISEIYGCLIEFNRVQKTLITRLEEAQ